MNRLWQEKFADFEVKISTQLGMIVKQSDNRLRTMEREFDYRLTKAEKRFEELKLEDMMAKHLTVSEGLLLLVRVKCMRCLCGIADGLCGKYSGLY